MNWSRRSRCVFYVLVLLVIDAETQEELIDLATWDGGSLNPRSQTSPAVLGINWITHVTQNSHGWLLIVPATKSLPKLFSSAKSRFYLGLGSPNYAYPTCSPDTGTECRFLDHCQKSEYLNSFDTFLANTCPIGRDYIGVCCSKTSQTTNSTRPTQNRPQSATASSPSEKLLPTRTRNATAVTDPCNLKGCGIRYCEEPSKRVTRLVGGKVASKRKWPWMVTLLRDRVDRFCGGVLVTDRHVLTAAHCVYRFQVSELAVRVGEYDFRVTSSTEQEYSVDGIIIHESFDRRSVRNDIALVRIEKKVVFTPDVKHICLPEPKMELEDQSAFVIGWGEASPTSSISDVLLEVELPIRKQMYCRETYGAIRINITDSQLCAGGIAGKDACQGASGGPLMMKNPKNDRWFVAGIVSFGKGCGEQERPGVYTRITSYLSWIKENVLLI